MFSWQESMSFYSTRFADVSLITIQRARSRLYSYYFQTRKLLNPAKKHLFAPLIVLEFLFLAGCATHGKITQSKRIEPQSIKTIGFRIENSESDKHSRNQTEHFEAISREISRRFSAVGYPVTAFESANSASRPVGKPVKTSRPTYSHILEVSIGAIEQDDTPTGFSFALGNSDPRAEGYQKTTVIKIACTLCDLADPESAVTLVEKKSAASSNDIEKELSPSLKRFYIENIGSTCHNLLIKLELYPRTPENADSQKLSKQPVRMETGFKTETAPADRQQKPSQKLNNDEVDQPATLDAQDTKILPSKTHITPKKGHQPMDSNQAAKEQIIGGNSKNTYSPVRVSDDSTQTGSWRDKQTTIFNQGDTVILEFGNERR